VTCQLRDPPPLIGGYTVHTEYNGRTQGSLEVSARTNKTFSRRLKKNNKGRLLKLALVVLLQPHGGDG
jgi:hypothetical protein